MFNRIYATGDTHGDFTRIGDWCNRNPDLTKKDILIILGDACFNYYLIEQEKKAKEFVNKLPITVICVHGNHEQRPRLIDSYKFKFVDELNCNCWYEEEFPNILFPEDGPMTINGIKFLVLGGAYSVDKCIRLLYGWNWFSSEQMSENDKERIRKLTDTERKFDCVLSHTCPKKFEPKHLFLNGIDQSKVDKSMEEFLNEIEEKIEYDRWLYGHFHADEMITNNVSLLFKSIVPIEKEEE